MSEITVSGHAYMTRKLPIFQQFHISRILAPILFCGPKIAIMAAFSRLSEADSEYIVNCALAVTQRKQPEANVWANIGNLRAPMFSDMVMLDFYEITAAVITESLGGFFPELLSKIAAYKISEA